jgi:riboflavin synthase
MFTGLIDAVGRVESVSDTAAGRELRIRAPYRDVTDGESIAVNGACLTVRSHGDGWLSVAAVTTTLGRTTIERWRAGTCVNLERALTVGDRLGGHFVQGHVDGVAAVVATQQQGDARLIDLALPPGLFELMVPHGSVAVDGVSLTVNDLPGLDTLEVSLIDYTLRHTTLGDLTAGDYVHVEADMLGKHVQRLLNARDV